MTWCGMCWWRSLAQWALEWSMARAKGWNGLNVGIIIPQLYNMNVYTFSNFFKHKFKSLLEYLGTKDNIKLNCGIIVSPSYNKNTNFKWHYCSHLTIWMLFFSLFYFFHTLAKNNYLFIFNSQENSHSWNLSSTLLWVSKNISQNFFFQSYVP